MVLPLDRNVTVGQLIVFAQDFLETRRGPAGPDLNVEYARGQLELIADAAGLGLDESGPAIARALGVDVDKLYPGRAAARRRVLAAAIWNKLVDRGDKEKDVVNSLFDAMTEEQLQKYLDEM